MGQYEVLQYLIKNGGWVTTREYSVATNTNRQTVCRNFKKVHFYGQCYRRLVDRHPSNAYEYKAKVKDGVQ